MSDQLERYSIKEIASIITERSTADATVTKGGLDHLDIDAKAGKESLGALADDGIVVIAALPREDGTVRLWFEETDQ